MPKPRNILNVKDHLKHCELIFEGLKKHGLCPSLIKEINEASLVGRAILRKHEERGTRKDVYVPEGPGR